MSALNVFCAQLTRDVFAITKFLFSLISIFTLCEVCLFTQNTRLSWGLLILVQAPYFSYLSTRIAIQPKVVKNNSNLSLSLCDLDL